MGIPTKLCLYTCILEMSVVIYCVSLVVEKRIKLQLSGIQQLKRLLRDYGSFDLRKAYQPLKHEPDNHRLIPGQLSDCVIYCLRD